MAQGVTQVLGHTSDYGESLAYQGTSPGCFNRPASAGARRTPGSYHKVRQAAAPACKTEVAWGLCTVWPGRWHRNRQRDSWSFIRREHCWLHSWRNRRRAGGQTSRLTSHPSGRLRRRLTPAMSRQRVGGGNRPGAKAPRAVHHSPLPGPWNHHESANHRKTRRRR